MQKLNNKKVLLLAPSFFGYEIEIKSELEKMGAEVYHYDERPKNNFFTKVLIRLNLKKLLQNKIDVYYKNIIKQTKKREIDYLLLINPETIDNKEIETIRCYHPTIKVYTYMWDSIKNKKNSLKLLESSDRFFTFDYEDKKINQEIKFLPLFYINDYKELQPVSDYQYDFTFIGTVHSDRYTTIKKIEKFSIEKDLKIFFYFYSPSRILFFFQRLFKKNFKNIDRNDISYESMSKKDIVNIISKSRVIIDIQHPFQNGLTMRTLEVLGAKRKLLTTNNKVKEYDFYDDNNILIFDRGNVRIDKEFINKKYQDIDHGIYEKYSINGWLNIIFEG